MNAKANKLEPKCYGKNKKFIVVDLAGVKLIHIIIENSIKVCTGNTYPNFLEIPDFPECKATSENFYSLVYEYYNGEKPDSNVSQIISIDTPGLF